jgi:uncharacterized protein
MPSLLWARITPRSSKPGVTGWRKGENGRDELEVRVCAAPAEGAANAELVRRLAEALGIAKSEVAIISGLSSRYKRISVSLSAEEVRRRLSPP